MAQNSHSVSPNVHSELSAEEFQKKLVDWFEDRGILSELRTHLRHQMVSALKDTKLGNQTAGNFRQASSPKLQAINLLVAEFLLQQEYHYTLSVFTSEIPLLRNLPEFTAPLQNSVKGLSASFGNKGYPRFQKRDVHDILEALGLSPNSEEGATAYNLYQNSREEPLLNCIMRCLPEVVHSKMKENRLDKSMADVSNKGNITSVGVQIARSEQSLALTQYELFTPEMISILLQSSLNSELLEQLHEQLKRFLEKEILQVREEETAKFQEELLRREHRIQMELVRHEEEIHQKLSEAEEHLAGQRRNIDENLDLKQKHLADLTAQLHQQQIDVSRRLREVEEQSELLKQREREVEEIKEEYSTMASKKSSEIKLLEEELNRLHVELETQGLIKKELEDNQQKLMEASQALLESQAEVIFLRNLQRQCAQLHTKQDHANLSRENSETVEQDIEYTPLAATKKIDEYQQTIVIEYVDKGLQTQQTEDTKVVERERLSKEIDQRAMYEDVICHLHQENSDLRERIEQQSVRIQELTAHAAQLANQLENVQTGMNNAEFQLHHLPPTAYHASQSAPIPAAPVVISRQQTQLPPPPPMLPRFGEHASTSINSKQLGAGEELGLSSSQTQPSIVNQPRPPLPQRESRRKPPRRLMVHNSTSSDESSPTDEILREARRRLRKLEEESADVDRRYHEFRMRHSESLATATASLLFTPPLSSAIPSHQTTVFNHQPLLTPTRGTPSLFTYRPDFNRGGTLYPISTRYDNAAVLNRTEIQAARISTYPPFSFSQSREPTIRYSLNSHIPSIGTESFASQTLLQSRLSEISNVNRFPRTSSDIFVPPLSAHQRLTETLLASHIVTNGQEVHHPTSNTFSKSSVTDKIRAQSTDSSSGLGTQQQLPSCSSSQLFSSVNILTVPSVQSTQHTNVYDTPQVSSVIKDTQQNAQSQVSVLQNESLLLPATDQGQPLHGIENTNDETSLQPENRVPSHGLIPDTTDSAFTLSQAFISEIPSVITNAPLNESLVPLERNSEKYYSALEVLKETDSPDLQFEIKIPEQECDSSRVDEGSSTKENKVTPAENSDTAIKQMVKELLCHGEEPQGMRDTINISAVNNNRRFRCPIVDTDTEALLNTFIPVRDSDQVLVASFTPSEKFSDGNLGLAVASAPLQKVSFSSSDTSSDLPISVGKESTKGDDSW